MGMITGTRKEFAVQTRVEALFDRHRREHYVRTDRVFAALMLVQWVVAVVFALAVAPRAWEGMGPTPS